MNNETINNFLNQVDSASPTPGGGCVAALVAQLGLCLGRMYGHLSVKRKAFLAQDETVQQNFMQSFEKLSNMRVVLEGLAAADMEAYQSVIDAYRQKDAQLIQQAIHKAIDVPFKTMQTAVEAMSLLVQMMPYGNQKAVSDCAIAVILCDACAASSYLNVFINIQTLEDQEEAEKALKAIDELKAAAAEMKEQSFAECIRLIKQ